MRARRDQSLFLFIEAKRAARASCIGFPEDFGAAAAEAEAFFSSFDLSTFFSLFTLAGLRIESSSADLPLCGGGTEESHPIDQSITRTVLADQTGEREESNRKQGEEERDERGAPAAGGGGGIGAAGGGGGLGAAGTAEDEEDEEEEGEGDTDRPREAEEAEETREAREGGGEVATEAGDEGIDATDIDFAIAGGVKGVEAEGDEA